MKNLLTLLLALSSLYAKADYWTQVASCPQGRGDGGGFGIGNFGYVGTGQYAQIYLDDFWQFNPILNQWTQKANYPSGTTNECAYFSIGNKGYIAVGGPTITTWTVSRELWEYDVATDTWTQKASLPGLKRAGPFSFTIGSKAYVGCGYDSILNLLNDVWEYETINNVWTQKANFGGAATCYTLSFSLLGKGYAGLGDSYNKELWEYDPTLDSWSQKASFPGAYLRTPASFALNNEGYVCAGADMVASVYISELWKYNPVNNVWCRKTDIPGLGRYAPCSFTVGNKAYVGGGWVVNGINQYVSSDFWEYTPDTISCFTGIHETTEKDLSIEIYPNPVQSDIFISANPAINKSVRILITDNYGREVYDNFHFINEKLKLSTHNFSAGIYVIKILNGNKTITKKFTKQ